MSKELVIAAFDRNYDWVNLLNPDVKLKVYTKGWSTKPDEEVILNNVGRDVHTFFYHLVARYDSLSDYTFFSQDYCRDHVANYPEIINSDLNFWNEQCQQHFEEYWCFFSILGPSTWNWHSASQFGGNVLSCDQNGSPNHPGLVIPVIWNQLFETPCPQELEFVPAGHFCVSRQQVHKRSKSFYQRVLKILETNPQAPWIIERLEPYIFNPIIRESNV
jgi:hypothetical protein